MKLTRLFHTEIQSIKILKSITYILVNQAYNQKFNFTYRRIAIFQEQKMSDPQIPPAEQPVEKTPEQLEEERKQREEQEKAREEQRKRLEEEARVKLQQDTKKFQQAMKGALSGLSKTYDYRSMAYVKLTLAQKQLQRVFPSILNYPNIQYLDISTNSISNPQILLQFPHLISLNLSKNQISTLQPFASQSLLPQLQVLNLSTNKIQVLSNVGLKSLRRLNLTQNQIKEVTWKGHAAIQILQLRKNKLKKLKGIKDMKSLKELYVCENEVTDIRGLQNLPSLRKVSLRNNKIKTFLSPFPHLPTLQYLNLRENQVPSIAELRKIPVHIRQLNLLANPLTQELGQNFKKQVIWALPHFIKLNKSQVTVQERLEFQKEWKEKQAERQRLQRQKEEQEKRRLAEESANQPQQ